MDVANCAVPSCGGVSQTTSHRHACLFRITATCSHVSAIFTLCVGHVADPARGPAPPLTAKAFAAFLHSLRLLGLERVVLKGKKENRCAAPANKIGTHTHAHTSHADPCTWVAGIK